jgi:hypothetical protein
VETTVPTMRANITQFTPPEESFQACWPIRNRRNGCA